MEPGGAATEEKEIERLVQQFAENVAAQTEAIVAGDARAGNRYAKKYFGARRRLWAMGDRGRQSLCVLLSHPRPDVRVTAAAYLLKYRTAEALAVLKQAAQHTGMVAFEAQQAIKRWQEGDWHLDD